MQIAEKRAPKAAQNQRNDKRETLTLHRGLLAETGKKGSGARLRPAADGERSIASSNINAFSDRKHDTLPRRRPLHSDAAADDKD
jgi:hypothetical protein